MRSSRAARCCDIVRCSPTDSEAWLMIPLGTVPVGADQDIDASCPCSACSLVGAGAVMTLRQMTKCKSGDLALISYGKIC
jgi:hypothetical protein